MDKIRDFDGKDITTVMRDACLSFAVSQEELDIEVLETGSPGIFGLCKKKARIRVQLKKTSCSDMLDKGGEPAEQADRDEKYQGAARKTKSIKDGQAQDRESKKDVSSLVREQVRDQKSDSAELYEEKVDAEHPVEAGKKTSSPAKKKQQVEEPVLPPSEKDLASMQDDITHLFELTGYPMQVSLRLEENVLHCCLSGEDEESFTGDDGRVLNSIQYLLRKMMSRRLPERMLLTLDIGDFRYRRLEELKAKALQMAVEVRESGKTLMLPALNPAERREIHIILRSDKEIRSRSVGDGLFKKVLIYKPAQSGKSSSRKQKDRKSRPPNGQTTEN